MTIKLNLECTAWCTGVNGGKGQHVGEVVRLVLVEVRLGHGAA